MTSVNPTNLTPHCIFPGSLLKAQVSFRHHPQGRSLGRLTGPSELSFEVEYVSFSCPGVLAGAPAKWVVASRVPGQGVDEPAVRDPGDRHPDRVGYCLQRRAAAAAGADIGSHLIA
jgi:hypothetical protein